MLFRDCGGDLYWDFSFFMAISDSRAQPIEDYAKTASRVALAWAASITDSDLAHEL